MSSPDNFWIKKKKKIVFDDDDIDLSFEESDDDLLDLIQESSLQNLSNTNHIFENISNKNQNYNEKNQIELNTSANQNNSNPSNKILNDNSIENSEYKQNSNQIILSNIDSSQNLFSKFAFSGENVQVDELRENAKRLSGNLINSNPINSNPINSNPINTVLNLSPQSINSNINPSIPKLDFQNVNTPSSKGSIENLISLQELKSKDDFSKKVKFQSLNDKQIEKVSFSTNNQTNNQTNNLNFINEIKTKLRNFINNMVHDEELEDFLKQIDLNNILDEEFKLLYNHTRMLLNKSSNLKRKKIDFQDFEHPRVKRMKQDPIVIQEYINQVVDLDNVLIRPTQQFSQNFDFNDDEKDELDAEEKMIKWEREGRVVCSGPLRDIMLSEESGVSNKVEKPSIRDLDNKEEFENFEVYANSKPRIRIQDYIYENQLEKDVFSIKDVINDPEKYIDQVPYMILTNVRYNHQCSSPNLHCIVLADETGNIDAIISHEVDKKTQEHLLDIGVTILLRNVNLLHIASNKFCIVIGPKSILRLASPYSVPRLINKLKNKRSPFENSSQISSEGY